MSDFDNYAMQQKQAGILGMMNTSSRPPTLQERLDMAVTNAEQQLADAKEARDIFQRNPDLERLLDIMQKGRF